MFFLIKETATDSEVLAGRKSSGMTDKKKRGTRKRMREKRRSQMRGSQYLFPHLGGTRSSF